jgi:hypothetical protein
MEAHAAEFDRADVYPVGLDIRPDLEERNRLTTAFRFFLAIPHLLLVGGPIAVMFAIDWGSDSGLRLGYGASGLLGLIAMVVSVVAWFSIVFTGRHPDGMWKLAEFYLRWRVRAISYMTLLRDEYPPFSDEEYPAELRITMPEGERDRLSVAIRILLVIPHMCVLWLLGLALGLATAIAWVAILLTGRYPATLYGFAIGALAWSIRVEAYMLLLRDEYPPFTLRA